MLADDPDPPLPGEEVVPAPPPWPVIVVKPDPEREDELPLFPLLRPLLPLPPPPITETLVKAVIPGGTVNEYVPGVEYVFVPDAIGLPATPVLRVHTELFIPGIASEPPKDVSLDSEGEPVQVPLTADVPGITCAKEVEAVPSSQGQYAIGTGLPESLV
jgi:hypothetical protein